MTLRPSLGSLGSSSVWIRSSSAADAGFAVLHLLAHELAVVARRLGEHLAPGGQVLTRRGEVPPGLDDLPQLLVPARQVAELVGVAQNGRIGQVGLDGVVLRLQCGDPVVDHGCRLPGRAGRAGRSGPRRVQSLAAAAGLLRPLAPLRSP